MTEYDPSLDPNAIPLIGEKDPPTKHAVRAHERILPAKPFEEQDPDQLHLFDLPRIPAPPRIIPVRAHRRRNPRRKETSVSMTPITPTDPVGLARRHDPETSHAAAEEVLSGPSLPRSQAWVLECFRGADRSGLGLIDHDLERAARENLIRLTPQRIRTARHDLTEAGYLRWSGELRKTPYGREARVHVLTELGRTVVFTPYHDDRTDGR